MLLVDHTLPPMQLRQTVQWQSVRGLPRNLLLLDDLQIKLVLQLKQEGRKGCYCVRLRGIEIRRKR